MPRWCLNLTHATVLGSAALASVSSLAAGVSEFDCQSKLPSTQVVVEIDAREVTYDYSKSVAELTRMGSKGGFRTLGLTKSSTSYQVQFPQRALVGPDGQGCMRAQFSVKVDLKQVVYVAKEFKAGSCSHREVMVHEMRHVKANRDAAQASARSVQRQMQQVFGNRIFYGNVSALTQEMRTAISTGWMPRLLEELKKADTVHDSIDSVAEYARSNTMCNGEVPKTLDAKRQG